MISTFQLLILFTFWIKGLLGIITVTQTPSVISAQPGETVKILCTFSQDISNYMNLYQLKPGKAPKLLVYYSNRLFTGTPDRFSGSYSGAEHTFTISRVQTEDEAEYHCGHTYSTPYTFGAGTKLTVSSRSSSSPVISMMPPSSEEVSSSKHATLLCLVNQFYPDSVSVSWTVDGSAPNVKQQDSQSVRSSDGTYSMSSSLTLPRSAWESGEVFACAVAHSSLQSPATQSIRRSQCVA